MKGSATGKKLLSFLLFLLTGCLLQAQQKETVFVVNQTEVNPRIQYGREKLVQSLLQAGYTVPDEHRARKLSPKNTIYIGEYQSKVFREMGNRGGFTLPGKPGKEGYHLAAKNGKCLIAGADASGILYGCLELASIIQSTGKLPASLSLTNQPEMVLRGSCIGLQKPYYLPGRTVYEYPYTPETFPWFYDKKLWVQTLDSMVTNRMNALYLWNGHPFASLVKLKDYPYAVEVDENTFQKNEDIFRFLTAEADKRGIWVIQMFYNIIVSKPFAEKHHIKTQDRERPIIPLIADYTRKSIAAFVQKYPNVGLMVCLGEAMEGIGKDDITWFTQTIIPGVKDGLEAIGSTTEPPIVLRAHDTDAPEVMKQALPLYKNLYTEAKFNGEALTTPTPRGAWANLHQTLSKLGSVQIENVHILANLEPFRYGSPDFIQQSVQGMHSVMGGNGLHLYPQASYWDWPYSADSVKGKRLLQIERDWIWYRAWSRYAWKANRNRQEELQYWRGLIAAQFGCSLQNAAHIIEAYEQSGEIAPKLLRRFGITDGNRQTLTLGMLMPQLINPYRFGLFTLLYEGESPEGEMLIQYAEKEWKKQPHAGETPVQIIEEVQTHGMKAVKAILAASSGITKNKPEFERLKNDMLCYQALARHYAQKATAALQVLRYKYSGSTQDLEKALPSLEQSVESYKELTHLTKGTYLYANSMQTQQRKIPLRGVNGTFKNWYEVLVPFEQELAHFRQAIDSLKKQGTNGPVQTMLLPNAAIRLLNTPGTRYVVDSLQKVFADTAVHIVRYAKELKGLKGVVLPFRQQMQEGTALQFSAKQPVKVLVGFFKPQKAAFTKDSFFLKAPELETNATANDYGQAETSIANGIVIRGMPPVNIHTYQFPAGTHELKLAKGACLVLGFVEAGQEVPRYDAGLTESGIKNEIDWLFE